MMDEQGQQLTQAITGAWRTRIVHEGVRSGLLDSLGAEPRPASDCAIELGLDPDTTLRILRALAALGLATQVSETDFAGTALGARLRADAGDPLRSMALLWGSRIWDSLETIGETLRTGIPGWGNGDFGAINRDPAASDIFNRAMAEQSAPIARALAGAVDFSRFVHVVDVGGGYGSVLVEVLRAHPHLTGAVCDLAAVADGARRYLAEKGVGERARFEPTDFFSAVPAGADAILLKYILHDWPDGDCARILRNCRAALPQGGTLLLLERILPDIVTPEAEAVVRTDIVMMPISGRERTLADYDAMFAECSFAREAVEPVGEGCSVVVARAV